MLGVASTLRAEVSPFKLAYMTLRGNSQTLARLPWKYKIFFTVGDRKVCVLGGWDSFVGLIPGGMVATVIDVVVS